jgi:hypothetical protein
MIKVVEMGFSRKRIGRDGKPRYTAYYLDIRGQERSAGTFPNKKDANDAWKKAEGTVSAGKPGDPSRGKQTALPGLQDSGFSCVCGASVQSGRGWSG